MAARPEPGSAEPTASAPAVSSRPVQPDPTGPTPMYSTAWFDTFASTIPVSTTAAEVAAIVRLAPPHAFRRLLDLGCGTGRVAGPLAASGYDVTGIDTSSDALLRARRAAPAARLIALDQRHVGRMRWTFDAVVVLWNSFGFGTRAEDEATVQALHRVLRPGGRLLLDMYHPEWLRTHPQRGVHDPRGATIERWVQDGRCRHAIRYADGAVDRIEFNVYAPQEIAGLLLGAGFDPAPACVWWDAERQADPAHARYQIVATRVPRERDGEALA